jgi:hypothetical protein
MNNKESPLLQLVRRGSIPVCQGTIIARDVPSEATFVRKKKGKVLTYGTANKEQRV